VPHPPRRHSHPAGHQRRLTTTRPDATAATVAAGHCAVGCPRIQQPGAAMMAGGSVRPDGRRRGAGEGTNPGRTGRFAATSDVRAPQLTTSMRRVGQGLMAFKAKALATSLRTRRRPRGCVPGCGHPRSAHPLPDRRSGQARRARRVLRRSSGLKTLKRWGCTSTVMGLGDYGAGREAGHGRPVSAGGRAGERRAHAVCPRRLKTDPVSPPEF
jgi:hypothetical protein